MTADRKMNAWKLNTDEMYILEGDVLVRELMRQLRIPNLFAGTFEHDRIHAFGAFDNHPTHWIVLHLWKGVPAYSPNHVVSRLVRRPEPNGLLFQAVPKSSTSRTKMEIQLTVEAREMESAEPFAFQQLPSE